tara:strand:+ start:26189 stop:26407 length:219 start_codon:yes stop_codon:yes gene_type:complete
MTPTIKCQKFNIKVTGETEVNVDLDLDTQKWVVTSKVFADKTDRDPTALIREYSNLEEAVNNARQIAGSKVV